MGAKHGSLLLWKLVAAGCLAILAIFPLQAQKADDRVELIMQNLPPRGTQEYKALLRHAGEAKGQVLHLTKCEMWSVRRSRVEALKKAAAAKNVTVRVLDESWNEVFKPMDSGAPMDAKAKSMMDRAMQSQSTAGMGMMSARPANVVEYALTKGMDQKDAAKHPMTIKIALNDKMTVTAVRKDVVITGDRCTWRGVVEGTEQPVTIMWWGSGRITGTIHYGDRLFQLKYVGPDMIGVVETMIDKMPDEHPRASPERMQKMQMQQDTFFAQGDSSAARPKRTEIDNQKDEPTKSVRTAVLAPKFTQKAIESEPKDRQRQKDSKQAGAVIDVMIAYTANAAANYSSIARDLFELAIEETNQSFRASKIDNVAVRLVHAHPTDYKEEGAEHFDHLWRMVDKGDGFLEEIPRLRDEKKADVVILVVDDPQGCGLATRVAADPEEAYAVVHHECAATSHSVAHEIGHIIGARHDRGFDKSTGPFPYGHGFVDLDLKWRTMMSYKASCNGCPRLPIWSTPEKVARGHAAGDDTQNNARVIREQAARVANFR